MSLGGAAQLAAQGGKHKHIGEFTTNANVPGDRRSPYFNWNDQLWNFGEGVPLDTGGVLDRGSPANITIQDVQTLKPWGVNPANSNLTHFVGQIRPANAPAGSEVTTSSFEIVVRSDWPPPPPPPNNPPPPHVVLVISVESTGGSARPVDNPFDPFIYPGHPTASYGLWDREAMVYGTSPLLGPTRWS